MEALNNVGFDLDSHRKDDYWIIEFNEGSSLIEKCIIFVDFTKNTTNLIGLFHKCGKI